MPIGEIDGVLKKQVGTQVYYYGTVMSDKIKNITYVPVLEQSKKTFLNENYEQGYQRPASPLRMRQFRDYLKENPNSVVPPVLLSSRSGWSFVATHDGIYGKLVIETPAAIIDGQHRIGGYIALYEDDEEIRPIDFILLDGLDRDRESSEFVTVNSTQKGVQKSLTTYLEGEEPARIAWALNEEEDSPFKGRITRISMSKQHLFQLHSVAKNVERSFGHGRIRDLDEMTKLDIFKTYWQIIADELEEQWADLNKLADGKSRKDFEHKLLELTGLIAWSLMAPQILSRSYVEGIGMNWDHVRTLVAACGHVDWRKDGQYARATGEVGGNLIKQDMERLLPPDVAGLPTEE